MSGIVRLAVSPVQRLLKQFPCVAVLGARQVGKSTLLRQVLPRAPLYDLENQSHFDRIHNDIEFFLNTESQPLILDESQISPELFKALRVQIDKNRSKRGQYLLSGSSSPELLNNISESLAGRIALFELSPFTLAESYRKQLSSFYSLVLHGEWPKLNKLKARSTRQQLFEALFFGGYPEPFLNRRKQSFFNQWMENYFQTYLNRDIRRLFPGLDFKTFQRFIKMLAYCSGEITNYSKFAQSLGVSEPTIRNYFEIAEGTYLWRRIPSFESNHKKRLLKSPKGHMVDSGLTCALSEIYTLDHLKHHPRLGILWESFVMEQLVRSFKLSPIPFKYFYYRTQNQAEVDFILTGPFGTIPFEIKLGVLADKSQLISIKNFMEEYNSPIGFVINLSEKIEQIAPNVYQIPASFL